MKPDRRVGRLAHHALNTLWYDSSDAAPDDVEDEDRGCCPFCCAPCVTLAELLDDGELDEWVKTWRDPLLGTAWWNDHKQRVDRAWMLRAWSSTDRLACHEGNAQADQKVTRVLNLLRMELGYDTPEN
jgi:hypothetical protein